MKVVQGGLRIAFIIFFISHIPITLLIDGQGLLSPLYPQILTDVVGWYSHCFGDVLMKRAPSMETVWFSAVICCELIFQLPFFVVATRFLLEYPSTGSRQEHVVLTTTVPSSKSSEIPLSSPKGENFPSWFRTACLIYGSHVTTTLVPIMATFVMSEEMSFVQKAMTLTIYSPYLIFPVILTWLAAREDFDLGKDGRTHKAITNGKSE